MFESERNRNLPNVIILNVREVADQIEEGLRGYLKEPPKGLYSRDSLKPLVSFDKPYSVLGANGRKKNVVLTPETTFISKGVVTDNQGHFVDLLAGGSGTSLFKTPQVPIMGLGIMQDCIDVSVRRGSKWASCPSFAHLLERHVKDEFLVTSSYVENHLEDNVLITQVRAHGFSFVGTKMRASVVRADNVPVVDVTSCSNPHLIAVEEFINMATQEIRSIIDTFVHDDPWGVYDIKFNNFDVTITRTDDFRIVDWMQRFGKHYK